jgi:DNA (cytosine-5)-methyltransferase 1
MNVLSLFSGIGGLELGLERAGMTVVGQVEIDEFCRRVLAKHWPEVPRHDDVRTCVEWWLGAARPPVHLLAGGPPCQGHSVAGKQRGTADERWGWPLFRDVAAALRPPWLLVENVPNLTRTGLRDILVDLADLGFDAWRGRVPAAAVGAPHLRWRLFVVAAHPDRVQLRDEPGWSGWANWPGPTVVGHDGSTWALADPGSSPGRPAAGDADERAGGEALLAGAPEFGRCRRPLLGPAWAAEPGVGRVVDGPAGDLDEARLTALGNAVVPQVAEHIGRLILSTDRELDAPEPVAQRTGYVNPLVHVNRADSGIEECGCPRCMTAGTDTFADRELVPQGSDRTVGSDG